MGVEFVPATAADLAEVAAAGAEFRRHWESFRNMQPTPGFVGGVADIDALGSLAIDGLVPDLTFILHLEPAVAAARLAARPAVGQAGTEDATARATDARVAAAGDRIDAKETAFHLKLHEGFGRMAREQWPYPGGVVPLRVVIDASRTKVEVAASVRAALHLSFPALPADGSGT